MKTIKTDEQRERIKKRYGDIAQASSSCGCGSSCCGTGAEASATATSAKLGYSDQELTEVPTGSNLGLGCGNPQAIAGIREGEIVLDLGSGAGFDCFLAARKTGPSGKVIGVDMTPEMLAKANENACKGKFENVEFRLGEIEHLPVDDGSVDVVISNCVINLSADKAQVFRDICRVLKPGGRVAVSDVVAVREIPDRLKEEWELLAGCVSGAALVGDVEKMLRAAGFSDVRIRVNEASREFIKDWFPGTGAEQFVASASIEAIK